MSVQRSTLALLGSFLVACSTGGDESITAPPISLNQGDGVVLSVLGAGVVDFSTAGVGNGDFMVVAHRRANGTVTGHFRQSRDTPSGTVDFSGIVTCVTIDPESALWPAILASAKTLLGR